MQQKLKSLLPHLLLIALILWGCEVSAENNKPNEPIVINATINSEGIQFSPHVVPAHIPLIIHVINKTGAPVELENSDTSVEVYPDMDKTFKVGLTPGHYVFFNDFNAHTKTGTLTVNEKVLPTSASSSALQNNLHRSTVKRSLLTSKSPASPLNTVSHPQNSFKTSEILFIIWRESVEALLVVGVVFSWLSQSKTNQRSGFVYLGLGVMMGLCAAIFLSFLLISVNHILSANSANIFQAIMTLIAAIMIVYMVKWMRKNGRMLKTNMHQVLEKNTSVKWRNISILTVVAVAIAREGSEASIFIYALGFGTADASSLKMFSILFLGVLLAIGTIFLLQLGNRIFSWRFFFKMTEVLLLLLGGGLLLHCVDLLTLSGWLIPLHHKIWDTSALISDGGFFAPMLSSFIGYRATPSLMDLIIYCLYWQIIYVLLKNKTSKKSKNLSS